MAAEEEIQMGMGGECAIGKKNHNSSWVWVAVDVEKMLAEDSRRKEAEGWAAQYIYRVPEWLKGTNSKAYQPQLVSLGPFHHGDPNLVPMEEHKCRALVRLINRSQKPLQDFIAAIDMVAEELQAAYGRDLHAEWRNQKRSFVELMLRDGCFLLEMMSGPFEDYQLHDPVFSKSGRKRIYPIILSDMLQIENQLPLLVLKKILGVLQRPDCPEEEMDIALMVRECLGRAHEDGDIVVLNGLDEAAMDTPINLMVLRFLCREKQGRDMANMSLRHHPLQLYHGSLTYKEAAHDDRKTLHEYKYEMMPPALEIHEAGIKFRKTEIDSLLGIHFDLKRGVLTMPVMTVVDSTESLYLNLMAFERLHPRAGDLVTAYVICMDNMIVSAKDVAMLSSNGLLKNMLGCDEEMFNGTLSRGQLLSPCYGLYKVQCNVKAYCKEPWHKWRATLLRTYFRNPWAFLSLAAAVILLIATLLQTVYTVLPNMS